MNPDLSPEEMQQLAEFNKELQALLDKYQYDLGAVAFLTRDGRVAARPQCFKREQKPAEQGVPLNQPAQTPVDNQPIN